MTVRPAITATGPAFTWASVSEIVSGKPSSTGAAAPAGRTPSPKMRTKMPLEDPSPAVPEVAETHTTATRPSDSVTEAELS